jgi:hypothetical protein
MIASESCCFNPKEYRYDLGYSPCKRAMQHLLRLKDRVNG